MASKQYEKGRNFEYKVRDKLIKAGFDVTRSAGSHGIKDLVAIKNGSIYYIQCKYTGDNIKYFIKSNIDEIKKLHELHKVVFVVAFRPKPRSHEIRFLIIEDTVIDKIKVINDFLGLSFEFLRFEEVV